ncbi:hydrogenase maturation protease [Alkalinema pantanalense CENA528]|uniref:hydrogenase maturation protease n=1 Tax=Alkalinema pantanalense TaxID=1620705 RepID=UPI003D6F6B19
MQILLIGVGNEFRQDDGVGLLIVRSLRSRLPPQLASITTIEASGEGAALMEAWQGFDRVYLFDAVASGAAAGTIHRIAAHQTTVPTAFFHYSTHAFSVAEAVELARSLQQLPPELILWGIEGKDFAMGIGLSTEVEPAIEAIIQAMLTELNSLHLEQSNQESNHA